MPNSENALLARIEDEFTSQPESFMAGLKQLQWDQAKLIALLQDLQRLCQLLDREEMIERWLADGFWYLPNFIKTWPEHPEFPKEQLPDNFQVVCGLLDDLAEWFFTDHCPWEDPENWLALTLGVEVVQPEQGEQVDTE